MVMEQGCQVRECLIFFQVRGKSRNLFFGQGSGAYAYACVSSVFTEGIIHTCDNHSFQDSHVENQVSKKVGN